MILVQYLLELVERKRRTGSGSRLLLELVERTRKTGSGSRLLLELVERTWRTGSGSRLLRSNVTRTNMMSRRILAMIRRDPTKKKIYPTGENPSSSDLKD